MLQIKATAARQIKEDGMSGKDIDKALVILRGTKDGDELSPSDLRLLELYVNGHLNEKGLEAFDKLYESVAVGTYTKPYHLGVEHMTYDHEGYVYFKGQHVEHYSRWWAHSLDAKEALTRLQRQCLFLESKGVEISSVTAVWGWEKYAAEFGERMKAELDRLLPSGDKIFFSEITADKGNRSTEKFLMPGSPDENEVRTSARYRDFMNHNALDGGERVTAAAFAYGSGAERNATDEETAALALCFGYLKDNGLLSERGQTVYPARWSAQQDGDDYGYEDDEDEYER